MSNGKVFAFYDSPSTCSEGFCALEVHVALYILNIVVLLFCLMVTSKQLYCNASCLITDVNYRGGMGWGAHFGIAYLYGWRKWR